jgi:hypothetical protein
MGDAEDLIINMSKLNPGKMSLGNLVKSIVCFEIKHNELTSLSNDRKSGEAYAIEGRFETYLKSAYEELDRREEQYRGNL